VCRPLSKHFLYLSNPDFHPFHGKTLFSFSFQICEACGASRCSLRFSRANYCARILVQSTAVQSDSFANYTSLWDSFGAVRISAQDWISKFIHISSSLLMAFTSMQCHTTRPTWTNLNQTHQKTNFRLKLLSIVPSNSTFPTVDSESWGQELSSDIYMSGSKIESWGAEITLFLTPLYKYLYS
jgi:hypothetical protein